MCENWFQKGKLDFDDRLSSKLCAKIVSGFDIFERNKKLDATLQLGARREDDDGEDDSAFSEALGDATAQQDEVQETGEAGQGALADASVQALASGITMAPPAKRPGFRPRGSGFFGALSMATPPTGSVRRCGGRLRNAPARASIAARRLTSAGARRPRQRWRT